MYLNAEANQIAQICGVMQHTVALYASTNQKAQIPGQPYLDVLGSSTQCKQTNAPRRGTLRI